MDDAGSNNSADIAVGNLEPGRHNDGVRAADATLKTVEGAVTPYIGDSMPWVQMARITRLSSGQPRRPSCRRDSPRAESRSGKLYSTVDGGAQPNGAVFTPVDANDQLVWRS